MFCIATFVIQTCLTRTRKPGILRRLHGSPGQRFIGKQGLSATGSPWCSKMCSVGKQHGRSPWDQESSCLHIGVHKVFPDTPRYAVEALKQRPQVSVLWSTKVLGCNGRWVWAKISTTGCAGLGTWRGMRGMVMVSTKNSGKFTGNVCVPNEFSQVSDDVNH